MANYESLRLRPGKALILVNGLLNGVHALLMIKWENKALIHSLNLGILVVRHCRNHSGVAFISVKLESYDGIYYFLEYSHDQLVSFFSLATRTDHLLKNRPYYKVLFVLSYPVAFFFF